MNVMHGNSKAAQSDRFAHARKKGRVHRGGGRRYAPMRNDIARFLAQEKGALADGVETDSKSAPNGPSQTYSWTTGFQDVSGLKRSIFLNLSSVAGPRSFS